ncbi:hypothetical protein B0J13DRAFT_126378 [Dactylonectria estremocensis]|uniref:Uncharacterized protein n=1 Tax=Dactylonectria estremocensis TaxID=1079267 RepID=A0A9P9FF20_9HYPO|nr:hypothetical protein B0J13DRAFT_126378 [Dactylonectria estremocensis]
MIDDGLRLDRSESPSPEPRERRTRSTSSSYPSKGIRSSRIQSPVSDIPIHKLSLSNLSQFGPSSIGISQSNSDSNSSSTRVASTGSSTQEAIAEAAAVITQWQGEREPIKSYRRFELKSSEELQPEDSKSSQHVMTVTEDSSSRDSTDSMPPSYSGVRVIKSQYDGVADASHPGSPLPSAYSHQFPQAAKRKASQFSLRSLSKPFAKRPRIAIKRVVSNAFHNSVRQISRSRASMKRQHDEEMKQYASWKAMRRRKMPGDAIKGKIEKGFGTFSLERSRYGHEMWWKEGVERYHAPEWMQFGPSFKRQQESE